MKNVTMICCLLLCSFLGLIACSKNKEKVEITPPGNSDSTLPSDDTLLPPKYAPGDSLVIRGNISHNDETVLLRSGNGSVSESGFPAFLALATEPGGNNSKQRSIMKFRLRHVSDSTRNNPPQVQKAVLHLYQYNFPTDVDPYTRQQQADNGAELHRIVGDWQSSTVSWNTQPALAEGSANPLEDVVIIPRVNTPLSAGTNDNQVIDVTDMIRKILASNSNKGFLLKLTNENDYAGRSFGSFACPYVSKRPKLVLYF